MATKRGHDPARHDPARPEPAWSIEGLRRADVRKLIRRVVIAFAITFLVAAIGVVALALVGIGAFATGGLFLALSLACYAAGVACWTTILSPGSHDRSLFGTDAALQKLVLRTVLRGSTDTGSTETGSTDTPLTPEQRRIAARFAAIQSVMMPFQFGTGFFFLLGVGFLRASNLARPGDELQTFDIILIGAIAIVIAALTPFMWGRLRRVRRYRDAHQSDLIDTPM